jgi:DNA-binding winged helix-turn-helix (wHTH) protein
MAGRSQTPHNLALAADSAILAGNYATRVVHLANDTEVFVVDTRSRTVIVQGRPVNARLSRQEFDLLARLYERAGQVIDRTELAAAVWGTTDIRGRQEPNADDHMLHALVHRVRSKLQAAGVDLNDYLTSLPGVGYRLDTRARGTPGASQMSRRWPVIVASAGAGALLVAVVAIAVLFLEGGSGDGSQSVVSGASSSPSAAAVQVCGSDMTSPAPESTLSGAVVTFEWTAGCGMTKYDIWVGCSPGADDFLNPDDGVFLSATATDLPVDGGPLYVKLTSSNGTDEGTFFRNYTYTTPHLDPDATAVYVPGNSGWLDTGEDVTAGSPLKLVGCGQVSINTAGGPAMRVVGDNTCRGTLAALMPAPELPCFALIGRIGDGKPFLVGSSVNEIAEASGRLFLGVNDDNVTDNSGGFRVTVR